MATIDNSLPADAEQRLLLTSAEALRLAAKLLALLGSEYTSLREGDLDTLHTTTTGKQQLINQLQDMDEELRRDFRRLGVAFDAEAIAGWLSATNSPVLEGKLRELTGLLESCRQQNQTNGALIEALKGHTHRALKIFGGDCNRDELYSALGESRPLLRSRYTATV